jgi:phosphoglycerol transferase MdoB-like AlkP superfamily enzyme
MSRFQTAVGIGLLVLGLLTLLGELSVGFLLPILGIVLIVLGALMLLNVVGGGTLFGVITVVLGVLLYIGRLGVPSVVERSINLIVGVLLVIMGIARLA